MLKWLGLDADLVRSSLSLGAIFSASDSVAALQVGCGIWRARLPMRLRPLAQLKKPCGLGWTRGVVAAGETRGAGPLRVLLPCRLRRC